MKTLRIAVPFMMLAASALAIAPAAYQRGPKNLMSPTYRATTATVAIPKELTKKDVKRLEASAETAADHAKIANFYLGEAGRLEAKAAAYENAAAAVRRQPVAKNFAAPGTPARWEFVAKGFRKEAVSNRAAAAAHDRMAVNASAGF
jgi:hypothetical protein